jgi:hypothetical protein
MALKLSQTSLADQPPTTGPPAPVSPNPTAGTMVPLGIDLLVAAVEQERFDDPTLQTTILIMLLKTLRRGKMFYRSTLLTVK